MNTKNTRQGRLSVPLFALLVLGAAACGLGAAACGAAPDPGSGAEDPASTSVAVSSPPSTDPASDPAGTDAGEAAQPSVDEEPVAQSPSGNGGADDHPHGGSRSEQAPREK
jgi:hypothetical protein